MMRNSPRPGPLADATPAAPKLDQAAARRSGAAGAWSLLREILETLALALLVFLVIQMFWRNFWVEGLSMEPNIHDGQYLVVNHIVYSRGFPVNLLRRTIGRSAAGSRLLDHFFHTPQRGDVIVFDPLISGVNNDYIKRVVGLPGDKVEIRQGRLFVNDRALNEPYILPGPLTSWGPAYVGLGELFVLGDNRGNSTDSRSFGMLQQTRVVGQAWLCYWPPRFWGFIKHHDLTTQAQGR
jgi:signal peptidase I